MCPYRYLYSAYRTLSPTSRSPSYPCGYGGTHRDCNPHCNTGPDCNPHCNPHFGPVPKVPGAPRQCPESQEHLLGAPPGGRFETFEARPVRGTIIYNYGYSYGQFLSRLKLQHTEEGWPSLGGGGAAGGGAAAEGGVAAAGGN